MKKYIKPEVWFESFELSQQITAACAWDMVDHQNEEICYAKYNPKFAGSSSFEGMQIFTNNSQCKDPNDGVFCYENSAEALLVFNS